MKKIIILVILMMGSFFYFCQTPTELIVNGGFEQSKSLYPWVVETTKGGVLISGPNENGNPHGGNRYVTLGGRNQEKDAIEQTTIIPQNISNLTLSFALRIKSTGNDKTPHDFLKVMVKGEALDDVLMQYSNADSFDWQTITIPNLSIYSGKLITLRFEAETDGTKPTKFMIDDVSLVYVPAEPGPTPTLEFLSPSRGCLYPIPIEGPVVTGAAPYTVLAYSPNGIQSLTASIDDQVLSTTAESTLNVPINWSKLSPGQHTLTAELTDPIGGRLVRSCTIASSNLLQGGDFEEEGAFSWDSSATSDTLPTVQQSYDFAYSGTYFLAIGNSLGANQKVEQQISIPSDTQDTLTLSFFYQSLNFDLNPLDIDLNNPPQINLSAVATTSNSLSVYFIDIETKQSYLAGVFYPTAIGWNLCRTPISLSELGMCPGKEYIIRFEANTASSRSQATTFYIDDIALYVYSTTLASGTTTIPSDNIPDPDESVGDSTAPIVTSVVPHSGPKEGGTRVVINGANFDPINIKVKFRKGTSANPYGGNWASLTNGSCSGSINRSDNVASIQSVTPTQIVMDYNKSCMCTGQSCGTPKSFDGANGNARVIVINGNGKKGGLGWSNGAGFRYGYLPPSISSISPTTGPVTGGTSITLTGTDFRQTSSGSKPSVTVGGITCNNITLSGCSSGTNCSSTTITATIGDAGNWCCGSGPGSTSGPVEVKVSNPDSQAATLSKAFTFTPPPTPTISNLNPSSGQSAVETAVTFTGAKLERISQVAFGTAIQSSCSKISCPSHWSQAKVTTPLAKECGAVPVKILTVDGQQNSISPAYTYTATKPALQSFSPSSTNCSNNGTGSLTVNMTVKKGPNNCESISVNKNNITIGFVGTSSLCTAPVVSYISVSGVTVTQGSPTSNIAVTFKVPGEGSMYCITNDNCYPRDFNVTVPVIWAGGTTNLTFTLRINH